MNQEVVFIDDINVSELEVIYKPKLKISERPKLEGSLTSEKYLRKIWRDEMYLVEDFYVVMLDKGNRAIGAFHASKGGLSGTIVDIKLIYGTALKCKSSAVIMAHNHPSGILKPSVVDRDITKKLIDAGKLVDIEVLDHIILSPEGGYYSFADSGLI